MNQLPNYGDARQLAFCAQCGGIPSTRDHVPPKVFLDNPLPTNLAVVGTCEACNQGASLDEEYLACAIECAACGSVDPARLQRSKIRRTLERKPALAEQLRQSGVTDPTGGFLKVEAARVSRVILKLARGHALFWLNEPQLDDPSFIAFSPLALISEGDRLAFEMPPVSQVLPEAGSRLMQWLVVDDPGTSQWIATQFGRYRFLATYTDEVLVRLVIREYLACEVSW